MSPQHEILVFNFARFPGCITQHRNLPHYRHLTVSLVYMRLYNGMESKAAQLKVLELNTIYTTSVINTTYKMTVIISGNKIKS